MNLKLHKFFLYSMFLICCLATISFTKIKVEASLIQSDVVRTTNDSIIETDRKASFSVTTDDAKIVEPSQSEERQIIQTQDPVSEPTDSEESIEKNYKPATTVTNAASSDENSSQISSGSVQVVSDKKEVGETSNEKTVSTRPTVYTTKIIEVEPVNSPSAMRERGSSVNSTVSASEPMILKGGDIPEEKNPKISGITNSYLSVDKVELIQKEEGETAILLQGKGLPNSLVTIYVYSEDPVVITVKTDENGNWSYELTKELENGQHEVYVAVTKESGEIISKAEPIAFVKTAQAASMIPYSQLEANKAPMQRSTTSYILVAIVIMSVCLAVALALIGILTHKYKTDEAPIE